MSISGNVENIVQIAEKKMQAVLEHLKIELRNIRTGRANPSMLESISVSVYGTQMRMKEIATTSAPDSRHLLITPFDPSNAAAISKAVENSEMGFRASVDGNVVRVNIPEMDESVRKEMVKVCAKKCEEGKVGVRNVRRECNEFLKKQKADGDISEDLLKRSEKEIQTLTDKYCSHADETTKAKENEVLEI